MVQGAGLINPSPKNINMAGSVLGTLLEMVILLVSNSIGTVRSLFGKFLELGGNAGALSSVGGPVGAVVGVLILAAVILLLGKFVLGTGKALIFLMIVGILLVLAVMFLA